MAYIYTEFTFEVLQYYLNLNNIVDKAFTYLYTILNSILPGLVKAVIGYCHFYYQLGYGLVFYIYFFRRHRSKKNKNWKSFYGNSVSNWVLFTLSIFNKVLTQKTIFSFLNNQLLSTSLVIKFLFGCLTNNNHFFFKIRKLCSYVIANIVKYIWTPLFKRSSYISFLSIIKRFNKRK